MSFEQSGWITSSREFDDLIVEKRQREDGAAVGRITINRPHVLNAMTRHTMLEMMEAIELLNADQQIGVVVLTGAGDRAFCSGGDVKWEEERSSAQLIIEAPPNQAVRFSLNPVIAAVKGYAIGGGNHLAYTCDFTIAAENAIFGQVGPRIGSPADGYIVRYLIRVVGAKRAREIWMTGRRIDAQTALDWGLANSVASLDAMDDEVDRMCNEILSASPTCIRILKAAFDQEIDEMAGDVRKTAHLMAPGFADGPEAGAAREGFLEKVEVDYWRHIRESIEREGPHPGWNYGAEGADATTRA